MSPIAFDTTPQLGGVDLATTDKAYSRAIVMGLAGVIPASSADVADFYVILPFNMTLQRMKVVCKVAPTGAMTVQLRRSTNRTTPSWSDVTGFLATFTSGQQSAIVDPTDVDVNEDDLLGFSIGTGSGTNLLLEVVAKSR
jgi:hypothetical protein